MVQIKTDSGKIRFHLKKTQLYLFNVVKKFNRRHLIGLVALGEAKGMFYFGLMGKVFDIM